MELQLTPGWKLSTTHAASSYGIPVLVSCVTGEAYGREDVVAVYPGHGFTFACLAVVRLAKTQQLNPEGAALVASFLGEVYQVYDRRSPDPEKNQGIAAKRTEHQ